MGQFIMKFVLLLTFFAGLSTVAWAKCQQDSKCEGVCHPVAPDNSKGWYSTTNCRSGCKCWRKKECDIQHKKCSILNGTLGCVYGKPPSFSNLQAVFACDRCDPECNCWVKKRCDQNDKCKALGGVCNQNPPGKGWVNKFYCDWYTDCQCWVKEQQADCPGTCKQKGELCQVASPGTTWTMTGELCGLNGCKCWSQCYDTACARQGGKCSPRALDGSSSRSVSARATVVAGESAMTRNALPWAASATRNSQERTTLVLEPAKGSVPAGDPTLHPMMMTSNSNRL